MYVMYKIMLHSLRTLIQTNWTRHSL